MPKHVRNKRVFRREPEPELFPSSLESKVGPLVVRLRKFTEEVAGPRLRKLYVPQGGVPYDPVGLFCILLYGLMRKTSSTRDLEDRVLFDLRFQYLMRSQTPDHSTISRFRKDLGPALEEIGITVLALARSEGLIDGKNVAVDGTKIAANTSQWRKMIQSADEEDAHADPDAKVMKDRRKGTLRGFNAQIAVDMGGSGFILASHVSNKAKDSEEMQTIVENLKEVGELPETIVADAGYDSAPNHQVLENESVLGFVSPQSKHDLLWKIEDGKLCCPAGYSPVRKGEHRNDAVLYTTYVVRQCGGCPLKTVCGVQKRKTISARTGYDPAVRVANAHRCQTERGGEMRKKRSSTVERTFAQLKSNRGLQRFKLRGLAGVTTEFRLHCLAHNLEKLLRALQTLLFRLFCLQNRLLHR